MSFRKKISSSTETPAASKFAIRSAHLCLLQQCDSASTPIPMSFHQFSRSVSHPNHTKGLQLQKSANFALLYIRSVSQSARA
jgi:hypothetical protein